MEKTFITQEKERMTDEFTKGFFWGIGFIVAILILGQLIK